MASRSDKYELMEFQPETCLVTGGASQNVRLPRKVIPPQRFHDQEPLLAREQYIPGPVYILLPTGAAQVCSDPGPIYRPPMRSTLPYNDYADGRTSRRGYYSPLAREKVFKRDPRVLERDCCACWKCCVSIFSVFAQK